MFAMVFKCFLGVFTSVSNACFKCYICLLLYVTTFASGFKSGSGVAYVMRVGSGWRRERPSGRPTAGVLARELDTLGVCSVPHCPNASAQVRCPGSSKSIYVFIEFRSGPKVRGTPILTIRGVLHISCYSGFPLFILKTPGLGLYMSSIYATPLIPNYKLFELF
jgi:hypothetical protein